MSELHDTAEIGEDVTDESSHEAINELSGSEDQESEEIVEPDEDFEDASDEELEDVIDDEDATEEEVQEAKAEQVKRLLLKINGKDQEFDLGNDDHLEQLKQMAQKGEGADKKFQEAASLKKKMEAFAEILQNGDIGDLLKQVGRNPDAEIEAYMAKKIEELEKDPRELELERIQKELAEERKLREDREQEMLTAEQQRIQEEYSRQLEDEITDGLASTNLPKSPYVVNRIAQSLMSQINSGNIDVTVSDVLPSVRRQIQEEIQEMFGAMPEEVIESFLGDGVTTKLRKRRLSKMKDTKSANSVKQTGKKEINKNKKEEKKTEENAVDFFRKI